MRSAVCDAIFLPAVIAVEAYEAAAEACLRAGDNGEFLKCIVRRAPM